jgi:hypothetical protein
MVNKPNILLPALACFLAASCGPAQAQPRPLVRLHAHNDYEHKRPLLDALEHGSCSIEADVFLSHGRLLVAHTLEEVRADRTLERLYLEPLRERVTKNGGRVYRGGPEVTLLIDIKTDGKTMYPVLRETLGRYSGMLCTFEGYKKRNNAIMVIITGNRSREMFAGESLRLAALDGQLEDLDSNLPATLIPWISANWSRTFTWQGTGDFPQAEKAKLKAIVDKAHQQERRVRFWGAPDNEPFWRELIENGVDLINTDDLEGAQRFLLHDETSSRSRG